MSSGVFLFFGVKDMMSLDIVQSFTRTFHMPYISSSTSGPTSSAGPSYEVHMKPEISFAIVDLILHFGWNKIHYVYDSDEGLQHVQLVLTALRNISEEGAPFHISVPARRIYNIENAHDELRQLDKMDTDMEKFIIFDLSSERNYQLILRQIPEVGMNKEGYHYLIASLDFVNMNMSRYLHGGVNITGFQLLDHETPHLKRFMQLWENLDVRMYPGAGTDKLTYESALAVDVIEVITRALKGMVKKNSKIFQSTFRRREVYNYNRTRGIPCTTRPPVPWMHGDAIIEEIKELDFEGLSGRIRFDEEGYRTDYKLDVYTVGLDTGPTKIGSWTPREHFNCLFCEEQINDGFMEMKPKYISSILSQPFLMEKLADKKGKPLVGNARYQGFVADLAEKVAQINGFDHIIGLVKDGEYGRFSEGGDRNWTGMVGELIYGEADMCIAPLTITYDRERVIDFSKPFMNFGISIMIKQPEIMKPGVFSFMEPLNAKIWICIVFAYCIVSLGLFLVSRFSPYEWKGGPGKEPENKFNIFNALWFAMGALMLQGSDACPRSFSGRVIGTVWWFFVLIIISSYTANLAAFLTIERMQTPIESADDLARQTAIKFGTLDSGTTLQFFQKSKVSTYARMWNFMSTNPSVLVKTVTEGVERVRKSKGKYAFLLESANNEYNNNREPCDTMKVGPNLNSKGFGIGSPKRSLLRDQINLAVLELSEDGTLHKLKQKWWKDKGQCPDADSGDSTGKSLSLSNVAGVFYILVGGLVLSVVLASMEFICTKSKFMEKTSYMKATETLTTLVSTAQTPTSEKENGGLTADYLPPTANGHDREEATFMYGQPPPSIGFEHFGKPGQYERDHTEL